MDKLYGALCGLFIFLMIDVQLCIAYNYDTLSHNPETTIYEIDFLSPQKRGERLFWGLYTRKREGRACVSCHNVEYIDHINWNPSAHDISRTVTSESVKKLKAVLMNPLGDKMLQSHTNYNFTDEEVEYLRAYLLKLKKEESPPRKPRMNRLLIFVILWIVILFSLVDLFITRRIKLRWITFGILMLALTYQSAILVKGAQNLGRSPNYAPDQPIKFSHLVHATSNQIDCQYCHHDVDKSKSAGIPSLSLCLNCHLIVRDGTHTGKFEINKIHNAVDSANPVRWIRIHNLPDHVFFSHQQHVMVGKRSCQECHGSVEQMHIMGQTKDLSMGWCLDCHDKTAVAFGENDYYKKGFSTLKEQLRGVHTDTVTVSKVGGRECGRCHY